MRELVYYVAATLDGFIAREDGSFDEFPWDDAFGAYLLEHYPETFPVHLRGSGFERADNRRFDSVLMGRKTYEVGLDAGVSSPYPTMDQYLFSRSLRHSPDAGVELIRDDPGAFVRDMKSGEGRAIWICGGAELATALMHDGLIDRLILKLNPVLFGKGIPLFRAPFSAKALSPVAERAFDSGHRILEYRLRHVAG